MTSGPVRAAQGPAARARGPGDLIGRRGSSAPGSVPTVSAATDRRPAQVRDQGLVPAPSRVRGSVARRRRRGPAATDRQPVGGRGRLPAGGAVRHHGRERMGLRRRRRAGPDCRRIIARAPRRGRKRDERAAAAPPNGIGRIPPVRPTPATGRVWIDRVRSGGPTRSTGRVARRAPAGRRAPGPSGRGRRSGRPSPWNRMRSSSPAGGRWRRRSQPVARSTDSTWCRSDARPSSRWCSTPRPCASPSSRWRAAP